MSIFNVFSKRQRQLRGEVPDVYTYNSIPQALRTQIIHIIRDALGKKDRSGKVRQVYEVVHDILAREYGVFSLSDTGDKEDDLVKFFLTTADHEKALDVVEVFFKAIERVCGDYNSYRAWVENIKATPEEAVAELNARFLEHGIGYRYESQEIIRVDSEFLHAEAVKPALVLLRDKDYQGANEEFLKAHEHYRHNRNEETLNECLKALESTLKGICHKRKWTYSEKDTANKLLDICFNAGLIPQYLQSEFTGLRVTLESGVPTTRNKQGGHGRGVQPRNVPQHLAGYILNLTASSIVFLINAEKELK